MNTPDNNDDEWLWDDNTELNDDGYPVGYDGLDPNDPDNYDLVDEGNDYEGPMPPLDENDTGNWWDDETPIGLDYDGYNDPEDY